jgi:hypothetical protein
MVRKGRPRRLFKALSVRLAGSRLVRPQSIEGIASCGLRPYLFRVRLRLPGQCQPCSADMVCLCVPLPLAHTGGVYESRDTAAVSKMTPRLSPESVSRG